MPGSTPIYGFPYPLSTDLVANYPALGQDLAEDIEAVLPTLGGLVQSNPTTIANSGGTATLTSNTVTFTTVNSVSLNGVFTSTYSNYHIVLTAAGSTNNSLYARMRASGTDATGANYNYRRVENASDGGAQNNQTTAVIGYVTTSSGQSLLSAEIVAPQAAAPTFMRWSNVVNIPANTEIIAVKHDVSTAYDGITIYPSTGTITGTVAVYGYRK
jgi:hypothetical protein